MSTDRDVSELVDEAAIQKRQGEQCFFLLFFFKIAMKQSEDEGSTHRHRRRSPEHI